MRFNDEFKILNFLEVESPYSGLKFGIDWFVIDSYRFLVFTFAICRPSVCRLSVCLYVCNVRVPYTQAIEIFSNVLRYLVRWPSADIEVKFYRDRPRETPPSGELNTRGVAEYSDVRHIERYISETVQDRRYISINH